MGSIRPLVLASVFSLLPLTQSLGQCTLDWVQGEPFPGVNGPVGASVVATIGGSSELVVAGDFSVAGAATAGRIAAWDGAAFSNPFGGGVDGPVHALAVFNGDVVAAGEFADAGGVPALDVARWDGAAWHAMGDGLDGAVYALTVHDGQLYAAGMFGHSGAVPMASFARWDGAAWNPVGTIGADGAVYALASFNGQLYAAGTFTHADAAAANGIASWDGSAWNSVGVGLGTADATALMVAGGQLWVSGGFVTAGGLTAYGVARWDGAAWSSPGAGVYRRQCIRYSCHDYGYRVVALGQLGSQLFAAIDPGGGAPNVFTFNGASWTTGTAMAGAVATDPFGVTTLPSFNGELYIGGNFSGAGGPANFAKRSGTQWIPIAGINGPVVSITPFGTGLVALGGFTAIDGVACNHVAYWDGALWHALGAGIPASDFGNVAVVGTELYAAAWAGGVYHWDGSVWTTLYGAGAFSGSPVVGGFGGVVVAGAPYAGFGTVGEETDPSAVASWNGSSWTTMGTASGVSTNAPTPFVELNGYLYGAGAFGSAYAPLGRYHGTGWQSIGTYDVGPGVAVAVHNGSVYASIGADGSPSQVVQLVGTTPHQIGGTFDSVPTSLASVGGVLYAVGAFTSVDGVPVAGVASWDGAAWQQVAGGANGPVQTLAAVNGRLVVAGDFAGIGAHGYSRLAVLGCAAPACSADFNCDGDVGTDLDIEAFFACIAGLCPPPPCASSADFNHDGDVGTDADIEAFFRVLAGGSC